ncbi:Arginine biosynthesis bifunctional protein ArgJ beta chain [Marasmius fiardii PR-910]|nr:Arginine biosynthesis bifunctional protein ArgJ beta chain [Marasmius fiardii PR-910]
MSLPGISRAVTKRFSSTSTITIKSTPSKTHFHQPLPSVSFPSGYLLTGLHAGVKKNPEILDVGVILSTSKRPTSAAACFTKNAFKAAPVLVSEQVLAENGGKARAIVINSGCANAVTGKQGMEDAWAMVKATDALLDTSTSPPKADIGGKHNTLVLSTGVIGQNLPISKILAGIRSQSQGSETRTLGNDFGAWERAAKAFMTTDTFPKLRSRVFRIQGVEYRMAGMDKGAGMIHPDMGPPSIGSVRPHSQSQPLHATLLGAILTDAPVSPRSLQSALTYAVERSFNSISVDGEMSTNDTILVLANGAAAERDGVEGTEVQEIDKETNPGGYEVFRRELTEFAVDLAKLVVRDGEGATKFVTVTVKGAPTYQDAHKVASRISTSALVKTALYGEDANWGRVLSATGSVPLSAPLHPDRVSVTFVPSDGTTPLPVLVNGEPEKVDEDRASEILGLEEFEILVDLGGGDDAEVARYYTCDFSYEYVRINGDYRS